MRNLGLLILVSVSMASCAEETAAPAGGGGGGSTDTGSTDTGTTDTGAADTGAAALYRCADGSDIAIEFACDSAIDCRGGDDEKFCTNGGMQCDDKVLVDSDICDGTEDCSDARDEAYCP